MALRPGYIDVVMPLTREPIQKTNADGTPYVPRSWWTYFQKVQQGATSLIDLTKDVIGRLPYANLTAATSANQVLGRGSAAGAGNWQPIDIGTGLQMTGTTLTATGDSDAAFAFFMGGL